MSQKKLITWVIIVAILILIIGIYLVFFTSPGTQPTTNTQTPYSPFGNYAGSSSSTPTTPSQNTNTGSNGSGSTYINNATSPLVKISTTPIAGAEVFDRKIGVSTTTVSVVRYMDRATGHTMEYNRSTSMLSASSNTTIPTIYRAFWSGNTVLAQFLEQNTRNVVRTFSGTLPASTTPSTQLTGVFLGNNISTLAISPKGDQVFTIPTGDSAIGSISSLNGTKKTSILNFPFNEWTAEWPSASTITLTTKPSFSSPGFMYFLTTSGTMTKALGNIAGLTTRTSPNLGYTIYSTSLTGGLATSVHDFTKNTDLTFNGSATLPEKCVWSKLVKTIAYCAVPQNVPMGNYPDDWYQGNISFTDNIYKIDLSIPSVRLIYNLPTSQNIDVINPFLDTKEENLYFTNKNDYFLWGLKTKGL